MLQFDLATRNNWLDNFETTVGTGAVLKFFGNDQPVNTAAADDGALRVTLNLPSDWMAAASGGEKTKLGTWTANATAAGPIAHFRLYSSGGTCRMQGSVTKAVRLTTSALTAVNGNVLTFASTAAVTVGDRVDGAGIPVDARVNAKTSTTVTLNVACPAGVASGTDVVFGDVSGDMTLDVTMIDTIGQSVTVTTWTLVAPGA